MIIHLSDYQHLFQEDDATLAVQEALYVCRKHPGSILKLGGGQLHFHPRYAFQKEYYISNNDYSRKSIIFPLIGMQDLTIDGEGAELLFHGEVLPFVLDHSEKIELKNFTMDYPRPFFFQAQVASASEKRIELRYDPVEFAVSIKDGKFVFFSEEDGWSVTRDRVLCCEFDQETGMPSAFIPPYFACLRKEHDSSFLSHMYRYLTASQTAENRICLEGEFGHLHQVGNEWVCTFSDRKNPGIFCNRTKDIMLRDITVYAAASMGVICQLCENITLYHFNTQPRKGSGRFLSVNADATHFVNCCGFVRYEGCTFVNMLDDAGNIHGNYLRCASVINEHTLLLTFGHPQQKGVNLFDPGDRVHLIDSRDMSNAAALTVKSAELLSPDYLRLELEEELPTLREHILEGHALEKEPERYAVENFSKMPELYIHNCICGANRPRGFLPATWKKTVITNNTFYNMHCALHFTGDCTDWFESGPVGNVIVSKNSFKNSAYAGGAAISVSPHIEDQDAVYHRNIIIEDNTFEMHEKRFLYAANVENLIFRKNHFLENPALPAHGKLGTDGVLIGEGCRNIEIEPV